MSHESGAAGITCPLSDLHTPLDSRSSTTRPTCGQNVKSERDAETETQGVRVDNKAEPATGNY